MKLAPPWETYCPLQHHTFHNIKVQAFRHPLMPCYPGGPVLLDRTFSQLRHKRADTPTDTFEQAISFKKRLSGDWVYAGPKHTHFGHIMSEMVHRLVSSRILFPAQSKYLIVTHFDDDSGTRGESLCDIFREVLEFCEVDLSLVRILNRDARVESLSICEQGANLGGHPSLAYLQTLREFSTRRLDQIHGSRPSPERVYVSKSKISHGGTILGERYFEEVLSGEGFHIFHPQDFPLSLQMDVYRKAKELVFCEGSAFHGTELLGDRMLDRTFLLVRRTYARDIFANVLRPRSRELQMFLDTFFLGTVLVSERDRTAHTEYGVSLLDVDHVVSFFRDHRLARMDSFDPVRYFEIAEQDLRNYFSYHMKAEIAVLDPWRIGEIRLEFEKRRQRCLAGRQRILQPKVEQVEPEDSASADGLTVEQSAWEAHRDRKWLDAMERWDAYRDHFPDLLDGFTMGSIALIELGRFYEADALLRLALDRFPGETLVHYHYALVAHCRRDWQEAAQRWEAYRMLFPDSAPGYSLGSVVLCELGRLADADNLVQLGLQRCPDDQELLEKHAWIAHLTQDESESQRRWQKLRASYPNNEAGREYAGLS